jgi:uncharacterized protein
MEQLFGDYERPFFGQARVMQLGPLADTDLLDYVGERFEAGQRDVTPVAGTMLDLVNGHPQRAMLLAHYLWEQTPRGEPATPERWQRTLETVFADYGEALQATWDALETKEKAVLAALAIGRDALFSERTLTRFNLSKGGVQHARDALARSGHLHRVGERWELVDPLLTEWIVRLDGEGRGSGPE